MTFCFSPKRTAQAHQVGLSVQWIRPEIPLRENWLGRQRVLDIPHAELRFVVLQTEMNGSKVHRAGAAQSSHARQGGIFDYT